MFCYRLQRMFAVIGELRSPDTQSSYSCGGVSAVLQHGHCYMLLLLIVVIIILGIYTTQITYSIIVFKLCP